MTGRPASLQNPPEQWAVWGAWDRVQHYRAEQREVDPKDLDDQKLIEQIPKANLSNIHTRCTQIVERDLGDEAVPGLAPSGRRAIISPLASSSDLPGLREKSKPEHKLKSERSLPGLRCPIACCRSRYTPLQLQS